MVGNNRLFTIHTKDFLMGAVFDATVALQEAGMSDYGLFSMLLLSLLVAQQKTGMLKFNLLELAEIVETKVLTIAVDDETSEVEVVLGDVLAAPEMGH